MSIVFLNGCSSAGKTGIAIALQAILDPPHLRTGIDDALGMLPLRLHGHKNGFFFDSDSDGAVRLSYGSAGLALLRAHARGAAAMDRSGVDLILDEVLLWDEINDDWDAVLALSDVFLVGVHCSLAELERREKARGDRLIGQARGQYDKVHRNRRYNFQIDVTARSAVEAAHTIARSYGGWRQRIADRRA